LPVVNILGVNTYHGDASAAIVCDGALVAAAEEERFTRIKHDTCFPVNAIRYCLHQANVKPQELDHVAVSRDPRAKLLQRAAFALTSPAGRRMVRDRTSNIRRLLNVRQTLAEALEVDPHRVRSDVHFVGHHLAHLASSFFVSPFEEAALLSVDGFGDMVSATWGRGQGNRISLNGEVGFPHSLGVFYTALTQYLGFPKYGDEYKVMGLASYGEPAHLDQMRRIVTSDGLRFRLDLRRFRHHLEGASMTWAAGTPELGPLWGQGMVQELGAARTAAEPLEQRHRDLAASLQRRLEEVVMEMLLGLHALTRVDALCMAGGVALNCVVNGKIFGQTPFRDLYIQAAANDAGTSVGAAYHVHHQVLGGPRGFVMNHAYLGPSFAEERCRKALERARVPYAALAGGATVERTAQALSEGKVVGWFQGGMEFGPRALGNRSILADPRRPEMKDVLNARIKHREPFRPFAPSILEGSVGEYFEGSHPSPFMLLTYRVRPQARSRIPAPTHVDGTGRLQTVNRDQNPRFYDLIAAFGRLTGVPVLLNTSFNDNEPICCTPEEAVETFQRTRMDVLVLGNLFAEREATAEGSSERPGQLSDVAPAVGS
jgi:carbamoyltransferase